MCIHVSYFCSIRRGGACRICFMECWLGGGWEWGKHVHDCFTHMSFFHALFRRRLLLRSLPPPILLELPSPSKSRARRGGERCASCGERCERPNSLKVAAWLRAGNGVSSSVGEGIAGLEGRRGRLTFRYGCSWGLVRSLGSQQRDCLLCRDDLVSGCRHLDVWPCRVLWCWRRQGRSAVRPSAARRRVLRMEWPIPYSLELGHQKL